MAFSIALNWFKLCAQPLDSDRRFAVSALFENQTNDPLQCSILRLKSVHRDRG